MYYVRVFHSGGDLIGGGPPHFPSPEDVVYQRQRTEYNRMGLGAFV